MAVLRKLLVAVALLLVVLAGIGIPLQLDETDTQRCARRRMHAGRRGQHLKVCQDRLLCCYGCYSYILVTNKLFVN